MTVFVGVLSGKGGVAKTTSVVNMAAAMNHFGRDVVIVDGNLSTPNLGLHLGVPVVPITLHDVLKGKNSLSDSVYMHHSGIKIVPAGLSLQDLKNVDPEKLKKVLPTLDGLTDIVIVDGSAGLGRESLSVIQAVDELIIITNPELPAVTDALKTIRLAEEMGKKVKGVLLAKSGDDHDIPIENIQNLLERPVLGVIPHDKAIRESLIRREPVVFTHPKSKSSVAYKQVVADLIGVNYTEKAEGKFYGFLRKVGLK
jgi:septum site-determining protein MinD